MAHIYRLLNVATDAFYIGSALNIRRRKWEHISDLKKGVHHCARLQRAWDEYGEDAFEFEVLEEVEDASALQVEDMYLQQHAGQAYCYNTATSTTQPPSYTPEVREKISTSLKALFQDKSKHPRTGKTHSGETRAKISESRTGKMAGDKHYRYGKTVSAEVRAKIGDTQRGVKKAPRVITEEGKAKIRAAAAAGHYASFLGKKHSAETVAKMRKRVATIDVDGVYVEYESIQALRIALGIPPGTVNNALKSGKALTRGPYTGWKFEYVGGKNTCNPPILLL